VRKPYERLLTTNAATPTHAPRVGSPIHAEKLMSLHTVSVLFLSDDTLIFLFVLLVGSSNYRCYRSCEPSLAPRAVAAERAKAFCRASRT
jgi:hypothetical protein